MPQRFKLLVLTFSIIMASTIHALADRIDGAWCSPSGESMTIEGSQAITPGRKSVTGNYTRHHFDYVIPQEEKDAGEIISADQIDDKNIQVRVLRGPDQKTSEPDKIWQRCDVIS
jgi:hypothetical protein